MAEHEKVVLEFTRALVAGDFAAAHRLLAPPLAGEFTAQSLEARYREMIAYGGGPAAEAQIITSFTEWPDRQPGDIGWAYAAIVGPDFSEAVAGVVTAGRLIRHLEWGRP
jgi:hypothetical protein